MTNLTKLKTKITVLDFFISEIKNLIKEYENLLLSISDDKKEGIKEKIEKLNNKLTSAKERRRSLVESVEFVDQLD